MRRIEWGYQASLDLEDVADYYAGIDPGLPDEMITRIELAALPLLDYPAMGSQTGRSGLRKWRAGRTPFLLLYVVRGDLIFIARVVHTASEWDSYL